MLWRVDDVALLDVSMVDGCPWCGGAVGAVTLEEAHVDRTEHLRCLDEACGWSLTHDVSTVPRDKARRTI